MTLKVANYTIVLTSLDVKLNTMDKFRYSKVWTILCILRRKT